MGRITRYLGMVVLLLGVVSLALGIVFIVEGVSTQGLITEGLRAEKVTLGLPEAEEDASANPGDVVDTAAEAQAAQDILEEHLRDDYGTYGDTGRGSDERASYLDGTTLRNSLNLAIMGFGVSTVVIVTGVFMLITGLALGAAGVGLFWLSGRVS